jgi:hypothetical protein
MRIQDHWACFNGYTNPLNIYKDTVKGDTRGPSSLGSRNLRNPKLAKLGVKSKLLLLKHPQACNPVNPWPSQMCRCNSLDGCTNVSALCDR